MKKIIVVRIGMMLAFGMLVFGCSGGKTVNEVEPNDSGHEAQLINAGDKVIGEFQSDDDDEYYKIVLSKPGTLTISTESKLDIYYLGIGSLDEDGDWDDEIADGDYIKGDEGDRKVETYLSAGTYVIGVWAPEEGPYTLITSFKPSGASAKKSSAKALVGTWESDYGITWSFTENKFTQDVMGIRSTVPYKIKGNAISTEYQGAEVEMDFKINGDTLTIEVMGFALKFKKEK